MNFDKTEKTCINENLYLSTDSNNNNTDFNDLFKKYFPYNTKYYLDEESIAKFRKINSNSSNFFENEEIVNNTSNDYIIPSSLDIENILIINEIFNDKSFTNEKNCNVGNYIKKEKEKKKKGRKKDNKNNANKESDSIHDKFKGDNMRIKYKRLFVNKLINFINQLIEISPELKNIGKLQKLSSETIKINNKDNILKMLDLTAGEFLSQKSSVKKKNVNNDYNNNLIELIYKKNDITVKEVLNKTIRELMNIFCNDKTENDKYPHFDRLQDYIDKCIQNNENENYINKFKYQALNYERLYINIEGRKKKINKTNI